MSSVSWGADLSLLAPSGFIDDWLTKPYILSKALKRVSSKLEVKVLDQSFAPAFDDELKRLNLQSDATTFVRQVLLMGDANQALTYGRVVIPLKTYQAHFQDFEKLGSQLIGETLLYNNPDVLRSGFEYRYFDAHEPLWNYIYRHLPQGTPKQNLWARRSVFSIKESPILISELFLPSLPAYQPEVSDA